KEQEPFAADAGGVTVGVGVGGAGVWLEAGFGVGVGDGTPIPDWVVVVPQAAATAVNRASEAMARVFTSRTGAADVPPQSASVYSRTRVRQSIRGTWPLTPTRRACRRLRYHLGRDCAGLGGASCRLRTSRLHPPRRPAPGSVVLHARWWTDDPVRLARRRLALSRRRKQSVERHSGGR